MKKFLLPISLVLLLSACNKQKETIQTEDNTVDSTTTITENPVAAENFVLPEYSPEDLSTLLATKNNDTLYVTNFFATWCGPCIREIPHFKEKIAELEGKPVKFTFVSLDQKEDWNTKVQAFGKENNLSKNIVLLDGTKLTPDFFTSNFKTWDGGAIPFTYMKRGNKTDEFVGMFVKEQLDSKINSLLQ